MKSKLEKVLKFLFKVDPHERLKLFFLSATFFFVIGGYTVIKELKDSIFMSIVGESYLPWAKLAAMIALVPAILFYSFLVDRMRRYRLLCFYSILYGILGLVFAFFLADPIIGISNTDSSPYRIFGWLFYFFVEGYSPFVLSVFWAFANSINSPEEAKKNYGFMVSGSKLGGMTAAGLCWYIFSCRANHVASLSAVGKHQLILGISSAFLLIIPIMIIFLMRKVPGQFLHGYEAVYKIEKEKAKEERKFRPPLLKRIISKITINYHKLEKILPNITKILFFCATGIGLLYLLNLLNLSVFTYLIGLIMLGLIFFILYVMEMLPSGLMMIIKQPYVLGIFSIVFFYETINVVLNYQRLLLSKGASNGIEELSCLLFQQVFLIHFFGFFLSFFGTNALLRKFGERKCLVLVPLLMGSLLTIFMIYGSGNVYVILSVFVAIRAIHYAFSYPLRESLYIPTIKEIKFKSKSWIDSFGAKFAKGFGSSYNIIAKYIFSNFGKSIFLSIQALFFGAIIGLWFISALLLGKRYNKAVKNNEVIGDL